jgi:hypothetical protein
MRVVRDALSLALASSGLLGIQILLNDRWLWSAAPSHADGLIGFVAIDLILAMSVLRITSLAILGAAVASVTQFGAMFTDLVAGQPQGVSSMAFRAYLASDTSFIVLLAIQVAILSVAVGTIAVPIVHKHVHFAELVHRVRR